MNILRKQDLSITYWLKGIFSSMPSIQIVDGFPDATMTLPTVSIEAQPIVGLPFELGNRISLKQRFWIVDAFAQNKAQRDEIAGLIIDSIEYGIPVYNYDQGFPPGVSPSQIGALEVDDLRVSPIRVFPELQEKMYWRVSVSFTTIYHPITS